MSYFLRANDQETGPHSLEKLFTLWEERRITAETLCRNEDSKEWIPLGEWLTAQIRERDQAAAFTDKAVAQWQAARKKPPLGGVERVLIALGAFVLTPLIGLLFAWYYHSRSDRQRAHLWFIWSLVCALISGGIWIAKIKMGAR